MDRRKVNRIVEYLRHRGDIEVQCDEWREEGPDLLARYGVVEDLERDEADCVVDELMNLAEQYEFGEALVKTQELEEADFVDVPLPRDSQERVYWCAAFRTDLFLR